MLTVTVLDQSRVRDGEITLDLPIEELRARVTDKEVLVVKGVFPEDEMRSLVREIFDAYKDTKPRVLDYRWHRENHWRVDDNPPRSRIAKALSLYFAFTWNEGFQRIREVARMLAHLRNRIAGLPLEYGFRPEDDHWVIPTVQHHPKGGGFISKHDDPVEPDGCVVSLFMTKRGVDFDTGGLFVESDGEIVDLEGYFEPGDLFIFRPDVPHGVAAIDGDHELRFDRPDGRWRMAAVLTPAERP